MTSLGCALNIVQASPSLNNLAQLTRNGEMRSALMLVAADRRVRLQLAFQLSESTRNNASL